MVGTEQVVQGGNDLRGYHGFQKLIHLSPVRSKRCRMIKEAALGAAVGEGNQPVPIKVRFRYPQEKSDRRSPNIFLVRPDAMAFLGSACPPSGLNRCIPLVEGECRIRISSHACQSLDPVVSKDYGGDVPNYGNEVRLECFFEVGMKSAVKEMKRNLKPGEWLRIGSHDSGHGFNKVSKDRYQGARLPMQWTEEVERFGSNTVTLEGLS